MALDHLLDGALGHGFSYIGLAMMTGHPIWHALVSKDEAGSRSEGAFLVAGAALAWLGAAFNFGQATLEMAGDLSLASMRDVLGGTLFGSSLLIHLGFLVALCLAGGMTLRRRSTHGTSVYWFSALGAIATRSLIGHASAQGIGSLLFWAHVCHVIPVTLWLGGLCVWVERSTRGGEASLLAPLVSFSRLALWCVVLILPTGMISVLYHLPSAGAWSSNYGIALLFKLGLVGGILGLAVGHRQKRIPALWQSPHEEHVWRAFDRALSLELGLILLVTLVASVVSQLPPPAS